MMEEGEKAAEEGDEEEEWVRKEGPFDDFAPAGGSIFT
jgi:hypothetical protein